MLTVTNKKGEVVGYENLKVNDHYVNMFQCRKGVSGVSGDLIWYKVIITDISGKVLDKNIFHGFDMLGIISYITKEFKGGD